MKFAKLALNHNSRNMSNEDGTLKEVEVKEAMENLKIIGAAKVDIPIKVNQQFLQIKELSGWGKYRGSD